MSTRIQVKRGSTDPTGLTAGEFGYNTTNSTLFIGNTAAQRWIGGEVTGGVDMGAGSAASQNRVPTQNAVYEYARRNFVHRLNGITGGITLNQGANITITSSVAGGITIASTASGGGGALTADANIWTATQYFAAGFSAASGVTFTGTVAANGGLTASTLDVSGNTRITGSITATQGFTFGSGTTFLAFYPDTAVNNGGVYQRQGIFQLGGSSFNDIGSASFIINPNTETHGLYGNFRITTDQTYQAAQNTLTLNTSPSHTGTPFRVFRGLTAVASIQPEGQIFCSGISASGGITLNGPITGVTATFSRLLTASAGICAAEVTTSFLRPNGTNGITVYGANFSLEDVGYHVVKTTVMGATTVNVNQPTIVTYNHNIANNCTLTIGNTAGTVRVKIDQTGSPILYLTSPIVQVEGELELAGGTLDGPRFLNYREVTSAPAISAGTLTLNLANGNFFNVALNANITTLTISNASLSANTSTGFTLVFTADGTSRSVTWGGSILWASGNPPTLTSTNGKRDVFSFITTDGGTNWLGFVGGQNY